MLEAGILGERGGQRSRFAILQSHEPAHRGMPQVETTVPERGLSLEYPVGLSQPGSLELSECSQGGSEIAVQVELRRIGRTGLQEDRSCFARFLSEPCHVVRETLRVPDLKAEGPCRLKLSLAHLEPSHFWLSLPTARRDLGQEFRQANAGIA